MGCVVLGGELGDRNEVMKTINENNGGRRYDESE